VPCAARSMQQRRLCDGCCFRGQPMSPLWSGGTPDPSLSEGRSLRIRKHT
jgi:hypothetical protein